MIKFCTLSINSPNIETSLSYDVDIGLPSVIKIYINTRIMLRSNLWVEGGFLNGTMGTVKNIVYAPNTKSPALPYCMMIKFDNYKGPFLFIHTNSKMILPIQRT